MLDIADSLTVDGTTLFRDHEEPRSFCLLPDQPRVARDEEGRPDLYLLRYHRPPEAVAAGKPPGGGLLMARCVLAVDQERRRRLAAALRAQLAAGQEQPPK